MHNQLVREILPSVKKKKNQFTDLLYCIWCYTFTALLIFFAPRVMVMESVGRTSSAFQVRPAKVVEVLDTKIL